MINVKKVSDVGVRYLADGCHNLQDINGKHFTILEVISMSYLTQTSSSVLKLNKYLDYTCYQMELKGSLVLREFSRWEDLHVQRH